MSHQSGSPEFRTVLQKEVDADRMPGAVVMIARRGQLVYSEAIGFQDKAAGKPMTKDAIFRIFSMTKPLAAVGAMMLVEEGKVQLTDPVSKFLPQLAKMEVLVTDKDGKTTREPAKRQITIQDLFDIRRDSLTESSPTIPISRRLILRESFSPRNHG